MTRNRSILLLALLLVVVVAAPSLARRAEGGCERRDADTVVALDGKIMEMPAGSRMALFQADGKTYLLHMGPRWFQDEHGFALAEKDRLHVTGQVSGDDPGSLNLYPHSITRDGNTWTLADADGRPAWARSGKGGGEGRRGCASCGRERGKNCRDSSRGRGVTGPRRG
jgi:hypothetical protein